MVPVLLRPDGPGRGSIKGTHGLREVGLLRGKRILVTSGPTRAPLDAVRFISNKGSGR
ncbi:MAG: hypothetical protein K6U07_01265, partial [Firmicutes bacterium]|nr:hypothetical protein [Bacillota bacterium]